MKTYTFKRAENAMAQHFFIPGVSAVESVTIVDGDKAGRRALIVWAGSSKEKMNIEPVAIGVEQGHETKIVCDIIAFNMAF